METDGAAAAASGVWPSRRGKFADRVVVFRGGGHFAVSALFAPKPAAAAAARAAPSPSVVPPSQLNRLTGHTRALERRWKKNSREGERGSNEIFTSKCAGYGHGRRSRPINAVFEAFGGSARTACLICWGFSERGRKREIRLRR